MPIVITPNVPPVAAPGATAADIVLQAGSVISARVLQILGPDQVRIAIGGQSIDVLSQVPLQAGQTLQLQVSQIASGIGLAIVSRQGAGSTGQSAAGASTVTLAPDAGENYLFRASARRKAGDEAGAKADEAKAMALLFPKAP